VTIKADSGVLSRKRRMSFLLEIVCLEWGWIAAKSCFGTLVRKHPKTHRQATALEEETNMNRSISSSVSRRFWLVGVGALTLGFAALVGGQAQDAPVTLVYWTHGAGRPTGAELYMKSHPNVKIEIVNQVPGSINEKVRLARRAGSGIPDVIFGTAAETPEFVRKGFAADITPYVPKDILKNFAPRTLQPLTIGGKLYGMPNDTGSTGIWYNQKILNELNMKLPTSFDGLLAFSKELKEKHPGYYINTTFLYSQYGPNIFAAVGERWLHRVNDKTYDVKINTARSKELMGKLVSIVKDGAGYPQNPFAPGATKLVSEGKMALVLLPTWYGPYVLQLNEGSKQPGQWGFYGTLRMSDSDRPKAGIWDGGVYQVTTTNPDLVKPAAEFITWVTTSRDYYAGREAVVPPYKPLWKGTPPVAAFKNDDYYVKPLAPEYVRGVQLGAAWEFGPNDAYIQNYADTNFPDMFSGKVSVSEGMDAFQKAVEDDFVKQGFSVKK
jgi:multiple sugar transport system substrate-binding protein